MSYRKSANMEAAKRALHRDRTSDVLVRAALEEGVKQRFECRACGRAWWTTRRLGLCPYCKSGRIQ